MEWVGSIWHCNELDLIEKERERERERKREIKLIKSLFFYDVNHGIRYQDNYRSRKNVFKTYYRFSI